jgi:glycosyltransferase involved in cell wall biosynthesis
MFKDYDIIHFQGEADLSFLLFSYFVRKPKIFTSHSNYAKFPRFKRLFKLVFPRLADLYIAHELELLSNLGVPKSKSLVWASFGVDVEAFRPDEAQRLDNLILFVGRITKSKGLHILLDALPHVISRTQLVIIGPKSDAKYAEDCVNRINQVTRSNVHSVKYLDAMDERSLVPWYQKAAVLVRPDLDGRSGGLTSLEAMSCGTPIIGTGNHVVHNGVNGIVVPPNNPKELAKALNELLKNKELRQKYSSEGRKMVEKQFSWEKIVKKLAKVYEVWLSNYPQH